MILIYGAGGFAREVAWLIGSLSEPTGHARPLGVQVLADGQTAFHIPEVAAYVADEPTETVLNGKPVISFNEARRRYPGALVVIGVGDPKGRAHMADKCIRAGFNFTPAIWHPRIEMSEFVECGEGTIICAGSIITTNIKLGRHVHVNLDCTIGHDAVIGDFSTLAPGVHVSGRVHIGKRVYVGTGAVIINGDPNGKVITIEDDSVIAAGASVIKDTKGAGMYAGVPAIKKKAY